MRKLYEGNNSYNILDSFYSTYNKIYVKYIMNLHTCFILCVNLAFSFYLNKKFF